jgi:predicted RNA-binding protein with PUA-like domain
MHKYYLAVGDRENWKSAFVKGNIWGLSEGRKGIYRKLRVGDYVFFYVEKPVKGVVGLGRVVRKFRDSTPFFFRDWKAESEWPLRFEFDVKWPDVKDLFASTIAVEDLINPRASCQHLMATKAQEILRRCNPNLNY